MAQHSDEDIESTFPLLDLPVELWTRIVKMAVVQDLPIHDLTVGMSGRLDLQDHVQQPAITKSCRVVRNECLPVFYSHNLFAFSDEFELHGLREWLEAIGRANYQKIEKLSLNSPENDLLPYLQEVFEGATLALTLKSSQKTSLGPGLTWTKYWLVFQESGRERGA
ncbi:hypothetical protein LTR37_008460 [Vermiconidia calcicola]|uniref:Uncharacterized protein n=1 Tax=Vermiconidia calcicola TaxID=1690605 RepID=A0ACC3NB04_9PEZI|nr:hypothetical protein LTR37_008460 [Vermiconidia calcicola]